MKKNLKFYFLNQDNIFKLLLLLLSSSPSKIKVVSWRFYGGRPS